MTDMLKRPDDMPAMGIEPQLAPGVDPRGAELYNGLAEQLDGLSSISQGVGHLMLASNAALAEAVRNAPYDEQTGRILDPSLEHHVRQWEIMAGLGINSPDRVQQARNGKPLI